MDQPLPKDEEHTPECTEVKVAYDLSAIPLLGGLLFFILYVMVLVKLGHRPTSQSFWLQKAKRRAWWLSCIPLIVGGMIIPLVIPTRTYGEKDANDNAAQAMLKSIVTAQGYYMTRHNRYAPNLATLVNFLDRRDKDVLSECTAPSKDSQLTNGYTFQMTAGRKWTSYTYYVRCKPEGNNPRHRCHEIDQTGRLVVIPSY